MKRVLKKTIYKKGDCTLPYWTNEEGEGEGPWIVMLHGPCVDHRSFDPVLSELKDGTRVLLCDLRGHGNSEGNTEKITIALLVEDVLDILADAGISQAIFIGQSTGGAIVQKIAKHHPEMVLGLGLLGISCISSRMTPFEAALSGVMSLILKRYTIERMASNTSRSYSPTVKGQEYVKKCALKMTKEDLLNMVNASLHWMENDKKYTTDIPSFVAVGTRDPLSLTKKTFRTFEKTMSKVDLYRLVGGATLLQFDTPKPIAELIERLLLKIYDNEKYQEVIADYREKYEKAKALQQAEEERQEAAEKAAREPLKDQFKDLLGFGKKQESKEK